MADEDPLDVLRKMPSVIERGRADFEWIMEHGSALQKETVLSIVASMSGKNDADSVAGALRVALDNYLFSSSPYGLSLNDGIHYRRDVGNPWDGVALDSIAHPQPPWPKRVWFWIQQLFDRPKLSKHSIETITLPVTIRMAPGGGGGPARAGAAGGTSKFGGYVEAQGAGGSEGTGKWPK